MARARSLFARLLVAQVLVAIVLTGLLGAVFYVERNRTVARLVTLQWEPALRLLADGAPVDAVRAVAPGPLQIAAQRPSSLLLLADVAPRLSMVRQTMVDAGLPVLDLAIARDADRSGGSPPLWLALRGPDGAARWVGFESGMIETRLRERLVLAVVLLLLVAIVASALIARRLARPLETLRARIAADDADGAPLIAASVEVQAIDEAWRTLRRSLDRQERERALLLAGVSHDLRSPLGRIRVAAELLPDLEGIAPRRDAIVRNAALADRLVGSFVDHVRSGELPLNETVDIAAVARAAAAQAQHAPGELSLVVPPALTVTQANAALIERLIVNLLDNAFTHGRPPVTLRVAATADEVHVDVEDAGDGIAHDQQQAMLQAFARADAARQRPGLGLGLAVVQRVAARRGGGVDFVRSADGRRHVVRVTWPRRG